MLLSVSLEHWRSPLRSIRAFKKLIWCNFRAVITEFSIICYTASERIAAEKERTPLVLNMQVASLLQYE
jgi:hypothetical protein